MSHLEKIQDNIHEMPITVNSDGKIYRYYQASGAVLHLHR